MDFLALPFMQRALFAALVAGLTTEPDAGNTDREGTPS